MGKVLIIFGGLVLLFGLILTYADKIPLIGRLPGDIYIRKENFSFYFPLTTSIVISIIITIIIKLFK